MRKRVGLKIVCFGLTLISCLCVSAQINFKRAGNYYALQKNDGEISGYVYTEVSSFHEGKAWVNQGDLYGYIDTSGRYITDFVYADVGKFTAGFAPVSRDTQDGLYGFINAAGREICPLKYSRVKDFSAGFAPVCVDSLWTLLDSSGNEVFVAEYDYPPIMISSNFIIVSKSRKWGVVDVTGQTLYPLRYDLITSDGVAYMGNEKVYLGLL